MSQEPQRWISYKALTDTAATDAAAHDRDGLFPERAFEGLRRLGLIARPPLRPGEVQRLLRSLAAIGRGNLSVGRIYEGHVNALLLIQLFGTARQRKDFETCASGTALFGVWNTDLSEDPVHFENGILRGAKSFASGADGLSHAIVTVGAAQGRQMVIVPAKGESIDRSWWKPLGMRASGSHVIRFNHMVDEDFFLGAPGDYELEPWFSSGAIRFAAVQVGGTHAVFDAALEHLRATGRVENIHQKQRLGQMATEVATNYAWLDYVAGIWPRTESLSSGALTACVNAARTAIERAALNVLELAERSVGMAGMMSPHPLERLMRDLRTYLRQPNPDGALACVGLAVIGGLWLPGEETTGAA